MRQDSTTTILHDHDQPRLERSYTSSSEIEKGHPPKPAKSRHYFGIKLFLQKLLKLDPQESPEEGKLIKPGDVQLHDALAELSKLCDNIQTPNIEGNQTSDTEILTVITLKIIAALDILITANRSPQPPARATIDTILKHIGKEDSFLNSFQNFSNHHLIYHNDTNVFDSPELKWALFQIYWMLRDLAQNTTNRHDLTPEHVHSRALRKLPHSSGHIHISLNSFRLKDGKSPTSGLELSLYVVSDLPMLWNRYCHFCNWMDVHT